MSRRHSIASGREGVGTRGWVNTPATASFGAFSPRCRVLPADVNPCGLDRGIRPSNDPQLAGTLLRVPALSGGEGALNVHGGVIARLTAPVMRQTRATLIHEARP